MTTLKTFDFGASRKQRKWNWTLLTDGRIHKLEKGTDYDAKYAAAQIRVYAKSKNLEVKLSGGNPTDDHVVVQFPKAEVKNKAPRARKAEATAPATE